MVALSLEFVLIFCASIVLSSNSRPIRMSDNSDDRREGRATAPCFTHSDCLKSQVCRWDPSVAELAGACVFQQRTKSRDTIFQNLPSRFRRDAFTNRQKGRTESDGAREDGNYDATRWREGEHAGKTAIYPLSRENAEVNLLEEEDKAFDTFAESDGDVPDGIFPLQHTISDGIDDEGMVIDHFDEQGLPVVVMTEDNRDEEADYNTDKDVNVFGYEFDTDDEDYILDDSKSKNVDDYDIDRNGDERRLFVDLMDNERRLGIASVFGNPWGLSMRGELRAMNRAPSDDEDLYLTDDVEVYGAGDQRQGRLNFEHRTADYTGTGIEMDVGVDDHILLDAIDGQRVARRAV